MTTETQTKSVTYISDHPNRTLVIEGEDHDYNRAGREIGKIERTALVFRDYRCTVAEYDGPVSKLEGRAVMNGEVQGMDYDELIPVLEDHRFFGLHFWVDGQAPDEKRPTLAELRALVEGASRDELRELLATERETHNRGEAIAIISEAALNGDGDATANGKAEAEETQQEPKPEQPKPEEPAPEEAKAEPVDLKKLKRPQLDAHATKLGVKKAKDLPNKDAVIAAIQEAESGAGSEGVTDSAGDAD